MVLVSLGLEVGQVNVRIDITSTIPLGVWFLVYRVNLSDKDISAVGTLPRGRLSLAHILVGFYSRPIGQAIIFCSCGFYLLFLSIFLAYSQRSQTACLPYFRTWCGLSANLACRSEMCCTQLAEIQDAKISQKSPSVHYRTNLSSYIFRTKAFIDNREKLVKQQYLLMSSQYGELLPTKGWARLASLGHPANFNGFRVLVSLLHLRRLTEVNQTLDDVWPSPGLVRYVYIFGAFAPDGILSNAKFTLRPSLAFWYIVSVTTWHLLNSIQRRAPLIFGGRPSRWPSAHILVMAALRSRCGHYIFALWFLSFYLSFFSSPNLSGRRLDVYHTSTHGVALVRI